MFLLISIWEIS